MAIVAAVEQAFLQFGRETREPMDSQRSQQPSPNGSMSSATESIEAQRESADETEPSIASRLAAALEEPLVSAAGAVRQTVVNHPAQTVAAAVVAGVIVGLLAKRR